MATDPDIRFPIGMDITAFLRQAQQVRAEIAGLNGFNARVKFYANFDEFGKLKEVKTQVSDLGKTATKTGTNFTTMGSDGAAGMLALQTAVVAVDQVIAVFQATLVATFKTAADLQQGMTQLAAVGHFDTNQYEVLKDNFRILSREIPVSALELAELGRQAQLVGIHGVEGTERFVKIMADLGLVMRDVNGQAGDVSHTGEELVKFLRSIDTRPEDMIAGLEDAANSMAALKTQFGVQIPQVIGLATYWSSFGKAAGFTKEQILGVSAGLVSVGARAQASGSTLTKFSQQLLGALNDGGDRAEAFSSIIGITTEEFQKLGRSNPYEILVRFAEAMEQASKAGQSYDTVLARVGIRGVIANRVMAELAKTAPNLRKAAETSAAGAKDSASLSRVAGEATKNWNDESVRLKNSFADLKIALGDQFIPAATTTVKLLAQGANSATEFFRSFEALPQPVKDLGNGLILVGASLVGLRIGITSLLLLRTTLLATSGAFATLRAAQLGAAGAGAAAGGVSLLTNLTRQRSVVTGLTTAWTALKAVQISSIFTGAGAAALNAAPALLAFGSAAVGITAIAGPLAYMTRLFLEQQDVLKATQASQNQYDADMVARYGEQGANAARTLDLLYTIRRETVANLTAARNAGDEAQVKVMETRLAKVSARLTVVRGDVKAAIEEAKKATEGEDKALIRAPGDVVDRNTASQVNKDLRTQREKDYTASLSATAKKLAEINHFYAALETQVKKNVVDDKLRAELLEKINTQRERGLRLAVAQERADAGAEVAKGALEVEKARVDAMQDGLAKQRALRELAVGEVERNAKELARKYAIFPEKVAELEAQSRQKVAAIRQEGARADRDYIAGIVTKLEADATAAIAKAKTGVAGITAQAGQDVSEINRRQTEAIGQVGGDRAAVARIVAAGNALRQARGVELQKDLAEEAKAAKKKAEDAAKEVADAVRATRDRLRAISDAESRGRRELADLIRASTEADQAQDLRGTEGNEAAKLAVIQRYSGRILAARVAGIQEEYAAAQQARKRELDDALADPKATRGERNALTSQYRTDLGTMAAKYAQEVGEANRTAVNALQDAEKQAVAQQNALIVSRAQLNTARAQDALKQAKTTAAEAAGRQAVISALKDELALKVQLAAVASRGTDPAAALAAQQDLIVARAALRDAQDQDRAAPLQRAGEELDLAKARLQLTIDQSATEKDAATARGLALQALREEVALKVKAAGQAQGRGEQITAELAVITARKAVSDAEREDRQQRVSSAAEETARYRTAAEYAASMTVNAGLREKYEGNVRASLAAEAEAYTRIAATAASEQERNGYLDKAADLQRQIARSLEDSRKARLGDLSAARDQQAATLDAALNEARSATERLAARRNLAADAQEQVSYYTELERLYREQGRAQSEIGDAINGRRAAETRVRDLVKEQLDDQKRLADASKTLTTQAAELRDVWAAAMDDSAANRQNRALVRTQAAFVELERTTGTYRTTLKSTTGAVRIGESAIESTGEAISNQSKAISNAQQALSELRSEWEAQKSAVDSLNSSLNTFAGATKNQAVLDGISARAQNAYAESLRAAQDARARYGAGSPEYAAAVDLSAKSFQAASGAIKAAADNQAATVEASARKQAKAYQRTADAMGTVPEVLRKTQDAQQATYQRQADKIKQTAEDLASSLAEQGLGLDIVGALNAAQAGAVGLERKLGGAQKLLKGVLGDGGNVLTISVDPKLAEQVKPAGEVLGQIAARAMISELSRSRLDLERLAPSLANVTTTVNNTINIDGRSTTAPPAVVRATQTILDCAAQKGLKYAARRG
ncbi:hypothetical protein [Deinococcus marmoris]|uniref:TolA protein n=1 Tax=Deinococcus marmoris TaxID=249408 RepID=A0A1U7P2Y6_9DEIO|nr:hypothetical protein [Deinococcus marmoris]OLV19531.1 TolA protein [Deinococcus marmoris]